MYVVLTGGIAWKFSRPKVEYIPHAKTTLSRMQLVHSAVTVYHVSTVQLFQTSPLHIIVDHTTYIIPTISHKNTLSVAKQFNRCLYCTTLLYPNISCSHL